MHDMMTALFGNDDRCTLWQTKLGSGPRKKEAFQVSFRGGRRGTEGTTLRLLSLYSVLLVCLRAECTQQQPARLLDESPSHPKHDRVERRPSHSEPVPCSSCYAAATAAAIAAAAAGLLS